jgi:WhiB family transcriptional regulator, redox-sensing transcriptional regulator
MDRALTVLPPQAQASCMVHARCRDQPPAVFFPTDGTGVEIARRISAACPVSRLCREYALARCIDHGVWGGTSERARQRILRARRANRDGPGRRDV